MLISQTGHSYPIGKILTNQLSVEVGQRVFPNDLLIRPTCKLPPTALGGVVHKVRIIDVDSTKKMVEIQVTVRTSHRPKIGDKFTSRHAQKVTCSLVEDVENMPFCVGDGMIPDILVSPHSFPSRLTQGHLVESFASEYACRIGSTINASAFEERNYDLWKVLRNTCGYSTKQFEEWEDVLGSALELKQMVNGTTGQLMTLAVTVEPVYYHVLKHFVDLKGMVRTNGPVDIMTKQPVGGRKHFGGTRFGQMEVDCLIATGCSGLLQDRTSKCSDESFIYVCRNCGRQQNSTRYYCICSSKNEFEKFPIRHSTKLLIQELQAVNIEVRFNQHNG